MEEMQTLAERDQAKVQALEERFVYITIFIHIWDIIYSYVSGYMLLSSYTCANIYDKSDPGRLCIVIIIIMYIWDKHSRSP